MKALLARLKVAGERPAGCGSDEEGSDSGELWGLRLRWHCQALSSPTRANRQYFQKNNLQLQKETVSFRTNERLRQV